MIKLLFNSAVNGIWRVMKNGSKGGSSDQVDGESALITNHQKAPGRSSKDYEMYVTSTSPCTSSTLRFVLSPVPNIMHL